MSDTGGRVASALRIVGRSFGAFAGVAAIEHGYFEMRQGDVPPPGLYFPSMGPPCDPETAWHGCEPAITVLPDLLTAGIASVTLGGVTIIWALFFIARRDGGLVLALLSAGLLAVGGGVVPPVIGMVGGLANLGPPRRAPGGAAMATLATLWPWSLVAFGASLLAMVVVGLFANELVVRYGLVVLIGIPALLALSVLSAWARDRVGP